MDEALRRQLEHAPLIGVKTATAAMEFWKRVSCPWYAVELPTPKDTTRFLSSSYSIRPS